MEKYLLSMTVCLAFALSVQAEDKKIDLSKIPAAAAKQGVTFDTDIKPIFANSCAKCHGPEVEKPKGKFRSDTRASVLKGGGEGAAVTPGKPGESPLLAMIAHTTPEEDYYMPPKDNKAKIEPLTKEQVGLVRAWIEQGAK